MSDGIKRRDFLKVVGAGGAGAAAFGCSTENVERLIPYVVPPEDITPGVATWYATTCGGCSAGCGVWVRTREGRAVKLEGNPNHPISRGNLCHRGQASLQGLYNPDRFTGPMRRQNGELQPISWDEAEALLLEQLQGADQSLLVTGRMGPSMTELAENFISAAGGARVEHEPLSEAPLREAVRIAYGRDALPTYDLEGANLILSFGADFLETWLSPVEYARGFARSTSAEGEGPKGKFVFLGSRLSLTGQNADEWYPIRPGSEAAVALAMARIIAENGGSAGPYAPVLEAYDAQSAAEAAGLEPADIETLAEEFASAASSVAIGPGVHGHHRHATAANLAVLVLNAVAGNVGSTVRIQEADLTSASRPFGEIQSAIEGMSAGEYSVAMVHGTNPAYSLPPAAGFAEAFAAVPFKVSFAETLDETAALCDLILPDRHFLESWGDSNPRPGLYTVQQPVMQPVPHFDTRATGDVLLGLTASLGADQGAGTFLEYLQGRWQAVHEQSGAGGDFLAFWREALRTGVVEFDVLEDAGAPALRSPDAALSFDVPAFDGDGDLSLLIYPSARFADGRHANRPWLQELPDPVSKITWHSWIEVHPDTGASLGLREGDVVRVSSPHGEIEVPVWLYPGVRQDVVALALGTGHEEYGRYASGTGVNPVPLLPAETEQPSGGMVYQATRVTVEPTGERRRLASIAGASTQHGRPIAPAVALDELPALEAAAGTVAMATASEGGGGGAEEGAQEAESAAGADEEHAEGEGGHGEELYELQVGGGFVPVETDGEPTAYPLPGARHGEYANPDELPRWGMAIDLDKCTGCSACVTACQAENNVPWVGEDQILMGRDMNWMRIERYDETVDATHAGPVDVRHLPMLCQHCGNAPCEPVCPVFAAYHTPEGLNAQVYNRCVGTRYCANNCPYKVRVFNWYTFTDVPEPLNWQYNPDVTVRENGVMEKCTFCVQRIREAQNRAEVEGRPLRDGEVVTACQQTCPAEAITFGNLRDPDSSVSRAAASARTYRVLDEFINTQPAVTYQRKVTFHHVEAEGH
ncbi:MAG: 4Fe-4S dicluster domain-containing protein [Longimicrobiales bacterium]|nr:4Fe-4S dicluster domain-containing protein [Longimicrobiales bacterium]